MKITDWILPKTSSPSTSTSSPNTQQKENRHSNSTDKMPPKEKKSTGGGGHSSSSPPKEKKSTGGGSSPPKEKKSTAESSTPRASTSAASSSGTTTTTQGLHSTKTKQDVTLPQTKVKIIMKSSPEIDQVGNDVLFLISKATELFIDHITTQTYTQSHKVKNIEYRHLAEIAHKHSNLEFLRDIVPMKMTARDALKEVAKHRAHVNRELLGD